MIHCTHYRALPTLAIAFVAAIAHPSFVQSIRAVTAVWRVSLQFCAMFFVLCSAHATANIQNPFEPVHTEMFANNLEGALKALEILENKSSIQFDSAGNEAQLIHIQQLRLLIDMRRNTNSDNPVAASLAKKWLRLKGASERDGIRALFIQESPLNTLTLAWIAAALAQDALGYEDVHGDAQSEFKLEFKTRTLATTIASASYQTAFKRVSQLLPPLVRIQDSSAEEFVQSLKNLPPSTLSYQHKLWLEVLIQAAGAAGYASYSQGKSYETLVEFKVAVLAAHLRYGGEHQQTINRLANLFLMHLTAGRDAESVAQTQILLDRLHKLPYTELRAQLVANLASAFNQTSQPVRALAVLQEHVHLFSIAPHWVGLNQTISTENSPKTLIKKNLQGAFLYQTAFAQFSLGDLTAALNSANEALKLQVDVRSASQGSVSSFATRALIARIQAALGEHTIALEHAQAAVAGEARNSQSSTHYLRALSALADVYRSAQQSEGLIKTLRRIVMVAQSQRSLSSAGLAFDAQRFAIWSRSYRELALLHAAGGQCDLALATSALLKGLLLSQHVVSKRVQTFDQADSRTQEAMIKLLGQGKESKPLTAEDVEYTSDLRAKVISAGEVVVDYVLFDDRLLVSTLSMEENGKTEKPTLNCQIISAKGLAPTAQSLFELVTLQQTPLRADAPVWRVQHGFKLSVSRPVDAEQAVSAWQLPANWLAQRLLPIEMSGMLGRATRIVFVPDAGLDDMPWRLIQLAHRASTISNFKQHPEIAIAFGLERTSAQFNRKRVEQTPWLVIAERDKLVATDKVNIDAPLPGVAQERKMLQSIAARDSQFISFKKWRKTLAKRVPGQRTAYSLVHFGAHAITGQSTPLASGFSTVHTNTQATYGDFELSARDILAEGLQPELFVLAGCATATGASVSGEGAMGLTYAALAGGAKNVVATLWPVDDAATAYLMSRFYTALKRGETPAKALAIAQADTAAFPAYSAPFFWAGFILAQ